LRITVEFDPRFAKEAFALFGSRGTPLAVAALTQAATVAHAQSEAAKPYELNPPSIVKPANQLAKKLMADGYFRNPKLWDAMEINEIYTQAEHKLFIEQSKCCSESPNICGGDVVLHHVRTSANSGVGMKPTHWFGVPLCRKHHDEFHQNGTREDKDAFMVLAMKFTSDQMKMAFKNYIGIESLADLTIQQLNTFELSIGL
jgi:hypothetical protein